MTPGSPLPVLRRAPGFVRKQVRRVVVSRALAYYFRRRPAHRALDERRATEAVRTADSVLFCCWGNVCRSPFAARSLRASLEELEATGPVVRSAGLGERAGGPSPPLAVEVADDHGVDLAGHRSVRADASLVADSDVIFVMDYHNYYLLFARHGAPDADVFFLSTFDPESDAVAIPDPHGADREAFERVYGRIAGAVEAVAAAVRSAEARRAPGTGADGEANRPPGRPD